MAQRKPKRVKWSPAIERALRAQICEAETKWAESVLQSGKEDPPGLLVQVSSCVLKSVLNRATRGYADLQSANADLRRQLANLKAMRLAASKSPTE